MFLAERYNIFPFPKQAQLAKIQQNSTSRVFDANILARSLYEPFQAQYILKLSQKHSRKEMSYGVRI